MERRFGEHRLAGQQRSVEALCQSDGPNVVPVMTVGKRHQEPGVRDASHRSEKPFRVERFLGPRTAPASRMYGRLPALVLAASSCWRTISP
jgi:hypothetical protein